MSDALETRHRPLECMAPHRHGGAFAALVLDGGYHEASADGRIACERGVLTVHPGWHLHADTFGADGAVILNLPAPLADGLRSLRVSDVEAMERLARRNPLEAAKAAHEESRVVLPLAPARWLVRFAAMLASEERAPITELAARCGVSAAHAIRTCKAWFALSPAQLRRERRLQHAIAMLSGGASPADAAIACGFSDQPHLTRLLRRATGLTPARLAGT